MVGSGKTFDRIVTTLVLAFSFVGGAAADLRGSGVKADSVVVETEWGAVRGTSDGEVSAWKGIPYATPPVGELRWRPPVDPEPWSDELDATALGPPCPQLDDDGFVIGDEDCLQLNVWSPSGAGAGSGLPVLVFIHGGGNVQGSVSVSYNGQYLYDGAELARRTGVVVVTTQYRLGAFGFLVHPRLDAENPHGTSGNYGLRDQIAALGWVRRNIESFGGDPDHVLLFGESGGAVDTCMLLTSPRAAGLFTAALIQSGSCLAKPARERAFEGLAIADEVGCSGVEDPPACLRSVAAADLVEAMGGEVISIGLVTGIVGPVVDGDVVPRSPERMLETGDHNPVPLIIGSNADEMLMNVPEMGPVVYELGVRGLLGSFGPGAADGALALYRVGQGEGEYETGKEAFAAVVSDAQFVCPTRRIARLASASGVAPVYRYFFTERLGMPPWTDLGAFHGLELWFVFQHLEQIRAFVPTEEELGLEAAVGAYWARFAGTGDPNGEDAVVWPQYDPVTDPYLELGTTIAAGSGVRTEKCDFWDGLPPVVLAPRQPARRLSAE